MMKIMTGFLAGVCVCGLLQQVQRASAREAASDEKVAVGVPCSKQVTSVVRAMMMVNGEPYRLFTLSYLGAVEGTSRTQLQHWIRAVASGEEGLNHVYEAYVLNENCRVLRVEQIMY